jgi:cob(I)alamin adenosyltransferase
MKITTRKGDHGQTAILGARQVSKSHPLIELIGQIDELQTVIGLLKTKITKKVEKEFLTDLQQKIYQVMAEIAGSKALEKLIITGWVRQLEAEQNRLGHKITLKNQFVIPGENEKESLAHLVRVKTRSVERLICQNLEQYPNLEKFVPLFNRLSDYFFMLSQAYLK